MVLSKAGDKAGLRFAGVSRGVVRRPLRSVLLAAAVSVPALILAGCGAMYDPAGFASALTAGNGQMQADAALAAVARGDYTRAELDATAALARDRRNPYALLAAGVTYHNTNRPARARQMYEELLALQSPATVSGPWWGNQPRLITEVAATNLRALGPDTAAPLVAAAAEPIDAAAVPAMPSDAIGPAAERFAVLARLRDDALITGDEYARRRAANLGALLPLSEQPPAIGLERAAPTAEEVVARLRALRDAFETRNVSSAQHAAERAVILDGLLPAEPRTRAMPALPPAGVLEASAMVGRLQRLREEGLISAAEQARERAAIERALRPAAARAESGKKASTRPTRKPAAPTAAATPDTLVPADGTGNPAATLRSGRGPLQILPSPVPGTAEEPGDGAVLAAAQGGAVLQPAPRAGAVPTDSKSTDSKPTDSKPAESQPEETKPAEAPAAPAAAEAAGGAAVHLASFRSRERAEAGWTELSGRFAPLKALSPRITRVDLGAQGTFYRLNAGPLTDRAAAEALCQALQAQYCKPVFGVVEQP